MQNEVNHLNSLLLKNMDENKIYDFAIFCNVHTSTVKRWKQNNNIPNQYILDVISYLIDFVIDNDIEKDNYFTKPEIAKYVYEKSIQILKNFNIKLNDYFFIDSSAGDGAFYDLFPENKIGIDLDPKREVFVKSNYLNWTTNNKKNILISNPPFGLRGNLALRFINHSTFANIIVMILPPLFNSDGKGVPRKRVKNHKLIYTENLPLNSYYLPSGKEINISTIFQIWIKKDEFPDIPEINEEYFVDDIIKIYSLSNGNSSSQKRNVNMINSCDIYLPSTCFNGMKAYNSYYDLPNRRGFGIVILKKELKKELKKIDWRNKYAFLSTNSALNLRSSLIKKAVYDIKRKWENYNG